ncbi:MAG: PfkB family carbohydrate kinase [Chloroflexi bacterium]|jgi:sugar/nucleoside kinase (ribokinase family)|nr:PfkB family carbohydrate kinase [Chloroflexota bacterium]
MIDVLGIGIAAVDDMLRVPHFPEPDGKVRVLASVRACGGLTATALVAAARLGVSAAFAGVLGDDDLSDFVARSLRAEGIDISAVVRLHGVGPGHSVIAVDPAGRRVVYSDPSRTLAGAHVAPPPEVVRGARVLLVDHVRVPASIAAAGIAREARIPVVGDLERSDHPRFPDLLDLVDHLVVPLAFGRAVTGVTDPEGILRALRAPGRTSVLTAGAEGGWYLGPEPAAVPTHRRAFAVEAIDTTGCGDAFHGAYAAGLVRGLGLADRVRLASAVAALTATRLGGQAGLPDRATVEGFLASRPG